MKHAIILSIALLALIGCAEIDTTTISDEELQRLSEQFIVCEEPYIRHGQGCCIDQDNNKICDSDENVGALTQENTEEDTEHLQEEKTPQSERNHAYAAKIESITTRQAGIMGANGNIIKITFYTDSKPSDQPCADCDYGLRVDGLNH
ncbi:hypothetical protein GOV10_03510, partial [Candidatus Woesearchaeota archaeon]|nr:hypothetical protein [Candidatus Woesearchaeota archaeon]